MKTEQFEKWKEIRKQGPLRYIFVKGVLLCGFPAFVVMALLMRGNGINLQSATVSFLLVALCGAIIGTAMWAVQERLFRNSINNRPSS